MILVLSYGGSKSAAEKVERLMGLGYVADVLGYGVGKVGIRRKVDNSNLIWVVGEEWVELEKSKDVQYALGYARKVLKRIVCNEGAVCEALGRDEGLTNG